jgi:hypothetical protein
MADLKFADDADSSRSIVPELSVWSSRHRAQHPTLCDIHGLEFVALKPPVRPKRQT